MVMCVISSLEPKVPFRTGGKEWAVGDLSEFQGLAPDLAGHLHAQISLSTKVILPNRAWAG